MGVRIKNLTGPSPAQVEAVMRGMRNPYNSWSKGDTRWSDDDSDFGHLIIGDADRRLAVNLRDLGVADGKFMRQLPVIMDITGPLYWWKQMDQYKVGTVTDSCSTMHTLTKKEFRPEDFSFESLYTLLEVDWTVMDEYIGQLNQLREMYLETGSKACWLAINEMLPQSYEQRRTWSGNYEVLRNIVTQRRGHKLPEWRDFIESLWDSADKMPLSRELVFGDLEGGLTNDKA